MKGLIWETAVVANGGTASGEVDLGYPYRSLAIFLPTITDSATAKIQVAMVAGGTYQGLYRVKDDGTAAEFSMNLSTGARIVVVPDFGFQHLKIVLATQGAERTLYVAGFDA